MSKAFLYKADALILDLEDSVVSGQKALARSCASEFLRNHATDRPAQLWVRINSLGSAEYIEDLATIVPAKPDGIVLPKANSVNDFIKLCQDIAALEIQEGLTPSSMAILPIATETPISIFCLGSYAQAGAQLAGLTWGAEDLSAAVGAVTCRDETGTLTQLYQMARSLCLAAAAGAGVGAIETVYTDFKDQVGLRAYCAKGRRDGFTGMMAIHPSQIEIINTAFTPDRTELEFAERVVALFEASPHSGTLQINGHMLDAPHLARARRLLATRRKIDNAD
jgi:citrate lyase subunit beta / citryl-CoA lyase